MDTEQCKKSDVPSKNNKFFDIVPIQTGIPLIRCKSVDKYDAKYIYFFKVLLVSRANMLVTFLYFFAN